MNREQLALRDPAMAALMGVDMADFGQDFNDESFAIDGSLDDFGFEFGLDSAMTSALNGPGGGGRFFANPALTGQNVAAPVMAALHTAAAAQSAAQGSPLAASQAATASLWSQASQQQASTRSRQKLIDPNGDSALKIERYAFYVNATISHLGTAQALSGSGAPQVNLRPQRITANVIIPGFVTLGTIQVANLGVLVGGTADAYEYNANGVGQHLDMPMLTPANQASFTGNYTGVTPLEYGSSTAAYLFSVGFKGPATMSAY